MVQFLLKETDIDINVQDAFGETALMHAIWDKSEDIVLLLLRRPDINLSFQNDRGQTAHSIASRRGYDSMLRLIKEYERAEVDDSGKGRVSPEIDHNGLGVRPNPPSTQNRNEPTDESPHSSCQE
jgi:ankyrin repeat protein